MKELREAVPGLSQVVAAVSINVRPATLSSWENGRSVPRLPLEDWYTLAKLYNVSLDELLEAIQLTEEESTKH